MSRSRNFPSQAPRNLSIPEALAQAHAHWNAGQADQADMLCQRVLAVWPGQADALHLLGLMAHAYGNLDLAIIAFARGLQGAARAGRLCQQSRRDVPPEGPAGEGEAAARRAVAMDATLPGAWNNLGIILQEAGKFEESRLCLERVLTLQPRQCRGA